MEDFKAELGEICDAISVLGWGEQRQWSEFFEVFKPCSRSIVEDRIVTNLIYYRTNYAIISVAVFLISILRSPPLALVLIVAGGGVFFLSNNDGRPVFIGERQLNEQEQAFLCAAVSMLLLIVSGTLYRLLWTLCVALIVVLVHMVFRPRSFNSKKERTTAEVKVQMARCSQAQAEGVDTAAAVSSSVQDFLANSSLFRKRK